SSKDKRETPKPEEPHSFIVEHVTLEKLQQILAASDRGTFMCRDEMAGLLEFGRYSNGTGASERRSPVLPEGSGTPDVVRAQTGATTRLPHLTFRCRAAADCAARSVARPSGRRSIAPCDIRALAFVS